MQASSPLRHGTALIASLLALAVWVLAPRHLEPNPYLLFVAAVAVSAYYGGLVQGVVASCLTALSSLFFYLHFFTGHAHTDVGQRLQFVLFLVVALLVSALTARLRRTQGSLHHQLNFTNAVASSIGEGICACDTNGIVTFANPTSATMLGWREGDLPGKDVKELVQEQWTDGRPVDRDQSPLLNVLQAGATVHADDVLFARRDGSTFPVVYTASPILTDHRITGAVLAFRDMSERKQSESALRESEDRYRSLVETSPDCIWLTDAYGYVLMANTRAAELFAYQSPTEMRDIKALELVAPECRAQAIADRSEAVSNGTVRHTQSTCLRADGSFFPAELSLSAITDEKGQLRAVVTVARDISDRLAAEAALRASESRLAMQYAATKALAQHASLDQAMPKLLHAVCADSGWDVGMYWGVESDNKAVRLRYLWRGTGVASENIEGLSLDSVFSRGIGLPGRVWESAEAIWLPNVLEDTSAHQGATLSREKLHGALSLPVLVGGTVQGVLQFFCRKVRREDSDLVQSLVAIATQIGQCLERVETEKILRHQSLQDNTTGLPNRSLFVDRLHQGTLSAQRNNDVLSVLVTDLDDFRDLNETFGADYGDMVLQQFGLRVREALRQTDTVARIEGDEFGVLLLGTERRGAAQTAEKLLRVLREPFVVAGQTVDVGVSMGIATFPEHGDDAMTLLRRADVALHVAKRTGCDYAEYSPDQEEGGPNRLLLTRELRRAVESNELLLHYLPKVNLSDGRISGVEALVRWQHPKHGIISPDNFITLVENTGLIQVVGVQTMGMALRQWRIWHDMGMDIPISVNLSPRHMLDPQLVHTLSSLLQTWDVDPSWIELELTEKALSLDPDRALGVLVRLHDMGMRISIDDFGTGYSSLAQMRKLPIDEIKIDRSFVSEMETNEDNAVIVRSIVALGHTLGLTVVAEGVESQVLWLMLAGIGCDLAQGSYVAEPLSGVDLLRRYGGPAPAISKVAL